MLLAGGGIVNYVLNFNQQGGGRNFSEDNQYTTIASNGAGLGNWYGPMGMKVL